MNIVTLFLGASQKYPDKIAIVEGKNQISFQSLEKEVRKTASYFQKQGIQKGDRVLVFVPMSIDLYRIVLALFYLGATAVFLDEWVSKKRMELCCDLAECKGFIGIRKATLFSYFSKELRSIPIKLRLKKTHNSKVEVVNVAYETPALITFTTGSTGIPKAANRTHGFLKEQFNALIEEINPTEKEVDMPVLPIVLFVNLGMGCTSVIAKFKIKKLHTMRFDTIAKQIKENKVTRITASPSLIHKLSVFTIDEGMVYPDLERIITGGGPVFPKEAEWYTKAFPFAEIKIVYGSTEAEPISSISANDLIQKKNKLHLGLPVGNIYSKTKLKIIPFTEKSISDLTANELVKMEVEAGEMGEIIVSGNHVLNSYYNNQEALLQNKIQTETTTWHRTGDSGFVLDKELFLLGRCAQVIRHNGNVYSPFVIENQLKQIEGIELGTVLLLQNKLTAVVESNLPFHSLQEKLTDFDTIIQLKKIPRDPRHHTKIDYGRLGEELGTK